MIKKIFVVLFTLILCFNNLILSVSAESVNTSDQNSMIPLIISAALNLLLLCLIIFLVIKIKKPGFKEPGNSDLVKALDCLDTKILITDIDTQAIYFLNKKARKLMDFDKAYLGQPCWKVLRGKSSICEFCKIDELCKTPGKHVVWDEYMPNIDKYVRHLEKLLSWQGKTVHLQEIIDISDIKRAEAALKRQLEQQQLITHLSQSIISGNDLNRSLAELLEQVGIFVEADYVSILMFDEESNEINLGMNWVKTPEIPPLFSHNDCFDDIRQVFESEFVNLKRPYIETKNINNGDEICLNCFKGSKVTSQLCIPFYTETKFIGALVLANEAEGEWSENYKQFAILISIILASVFERERVQSRLKRISVVVENLPSIIVLLNEKFEIEYFNPELKEILGYDETEIKNDGFSLLFDKKTGEYLIDKLFPTVYEGKQVTIDIPTIKKDGGQVIFELTAFLVPGNNKKESIAFIGVDVTDRKKLTQELELARDEAERASVAKTTFLSNISHEIRTPMTAILGMLEISMKSNNTEHIKNCLKKMQTSSYHLLNILNDVLDMAKIESGNLEMFNETFDLEKMLSDLIVVIGIKANEKEQEILVNINHDVPRNLCGDSMRLSQVILNLISNAVKFSPLGTKIYLDIALKGKNEDKVCLEFSVNDEGIGMSAEKITHIFKPFKQADGSITKRYGGTGLGLAISKKIVEKMDGEIEVQSQQGKGSTFTFTVNLVEEPSSENIHDWTYDKKVLIVDDSIFTRQYLIKLLNQHNIAYSEAVDGKSAIEMIGKEEFGAALIDYNMQGMNGIQIAIALKDLSKTDIDIALISMTEMLNIYDEAKRAGIDFLIQKPIIPSALKEFFEKIKDSSVQKSADTSKDNSSDNSNELFGKNILVVEDSSINREIARFILEEKGVNVFEAENGEIAVEMFSENPNKYDLILMDIQMPVMDGYTACMKIRNSELPNCTKIPIIAMTANVFSNDVAEAIDAKMDAHIGKPINTAEMYRIIEEQLEKRYAMIV